MNDRETSYPNSPGFKERGGTSEEAAVAEQSRADTIRRRVRDYLRQHNTTTDDCAAALALSILAVRPRFSELRLRGELEDTGERRLNASGKRAAVWKLKEKFEQEELI